MELLQTREELRAWRAEVGKRGASLGFVPTMGALHAGHRSLIEASVRDNELTVVSIFVNPTQFGPHEDFARYPRTLESDLALCRQAGVAAVFHPQAQDMYPPGFCTWVQVTGPLAESYEGAVRPGHFRGVATVVLKLLLLVQPETAYFGQKDAQQAALVRRMVADLDVPVRIRVCPTVREADGLALSSRNVYLSAEQRQHASVLYRALLLGQARLLAGQRQLAPVLEAMAGLVQATPGTVLDYVAAADPETFVPLETATGDVLLLLAVRFGATRLIDNLLVPASLIGSASPRTS